MEQPMYIKTRFFIVTIIIILFTAIAFSKQNIVYFGILDYYVGKIEYKAPKKKWLVLDVDDRVYPGYEIRINNKKDYCELILWDKSIIELSGKTNVKFDSIVKKRLEMKEKYEQSSDSDIKVATETGTAGVRGSINNMSRLMDLNELINKISEKKNLLRLDVSGMNIFNLEGINKLPNLKVIRLENNKISKIEGLETLTNLSRIHIYDNPVKSISSDTYKYLKNKKVRIYTNETEYVSVNKYIKTYNIAIE